MNIWKRLFGKATPTQSKVKLEDLKQAAEQIVAKRCIGCIFSAEERGLSKQAAVGEFIDASLGSVDVFIDRFGLSLEEAVDLYCMTSVGKSKPKEYTLQLLKERNKSDR